MKRKTINVRNVQWIDVRPPNGITSAFVLIVYTETTAYHLHLDLADIPIIISHLRQAIDTVKQSVAGMDDWIRNTMK